MNKSAKIYIAGHRGMVGSAIHSELLSNGYSNFILKTSAELDLINQDQTQAFFREETPDIVILAAAKVGGIGANIEYPSEFLYNNLMIQNNVIWSAFRNKVKNFLFIGSSCIYPRHSPQPMKEDYLLSGKLEPTNEGYALAKIAGIKLLEYLKKQYEFSSLSLMPCNLYGDNDSFDPKHSHVLSALVKKFVDATNAGHAEVSVWGSGNPRRELMHVSDVAKATRFLLENTHVSADLINVGTGEDISIANLATLIARKAGYSGHISYDASKPDGMLLKKLDVSILKSLGFQHEIDLEKGVELTIKEYKNRINE